MSELICQRKEKPALEFYDTDLKSIVVLPFELTVRSITDPNWCTTLISEDIDLRYDKVNHRIVLETAFEREIFSKKIAFSVSCDADVFCLTIMDETVKDKKLNIRNSPFLKRLKDEMLAKAMVQLFEQGVVVENACLPGFGYIKTGDTIISTFEAISLSLENLNQYRVSSSDENNYSRFKLQLIDCIIDADLKRISSCKAVFYCGTKELSLDIYDMVSLKADGLTTYGIKADNVVVQDIVGEKPAPRPKADFANIQQFIDDRETYLSPTIIEQEDDNLFDGLFSI